MNDFEKSFSNFIDSNDCERTEEMCKIAMYTMARNAFMAGWKAAGGRIKTNTRSDREPELHKK